MSRAALDVTGPVQRLQHRFGKAAGLPQHRLEDVRRHLAERWPVGKVLDLEHVAQHEQRLFDRGPVARHQGSFVHASRCGDRQILRIPGQEWAAILSAEAFDCVTRPASAPAAAAEGSGEAAFSRRPGRLWRRGRARFGLAVLDRLENRFKRFLHARARSRRRASAASAWRRA